MKNTYGILSNCSLGVVREEIKHIMARFLRGLDTNIVEKVELKPYWTFEDVCKLAIKVEYYSKNKRSFSSSYSRPIT